MRVLVCGGRRFGDRQDVFRRLDELARDHGPLTVIQSGGIGADEIARDWWATAPDETNLITELASWDDLSEPDAAIRRRADGSEYDALAGPRRNRRMLMHRPDLVLAFEGGKGTADMVRQARQAGVRVVEVFATPDGCGKTT